MKFRYCVPALAALSLFSFSPIASAATAYENFVTVSDVFESADATVPQKEKLEVVYFFQEGCTYCKKLLPWLNTYEEKHSDVLSITRIDIADGGESFELFEKAMIEHEVPKEDYGAPAMVVGDNIFIGLSAIKKGLPAEVDSFQAAKKQNSDGKK